MTFILAIEPDAALADVLQRTVPDRVGADLVVVKSAAAAILEINKRVPDVLLVGRSVWPADREVIIAHTESIGRIAGLITISIPALRIATPPEPQRSRFRLRRSAPTETEEWEPILFVDEIARKLDDRRRSSVEALERSDLFEPSGEPAQPERSEYCGQEGIAPDDGALPVALEGSSDTSRDAAVREARTIAGASARETLSTELANMRIEAEDAWSIGLAKTRMEAEATLMSELSRIRAEVERTLGQAAQTLATETHRVRAETEARLDTELSRVREEAERIPRARAESQAKFDAELTRFREEAAQARLAHEQVRCEADASREEMLNQAIAAAEAWARDAWSIERAEARREAEATLTSAARRLDPMVAQALEAAMSRVRADAEARLDAELSRVREAGGEIARVRAESQTKFDAELARFREETEQARLEREWAQAELERLTRESAHTDATALRASVEQQARFVAEETATRALGTEVARLRAGAEARLETDLAVLRQRADHVEVDHQQHKLAMERIREQALKDARSFSDAMALELARARERTADHELSATLASQARETTRRGGRKGHARLTLATAAGVIGAVAALSMPPGGETAAFEWIDSVRLLGSSLPAEEVRPASPPSAPAASRAPRRAQPGALSASRTAEGGFLTVSAGIPLELYAGSQRIGETGDGQLPVAAGRQTINVVSERFNFRGALPLEVRTGELTSHTVDLPPAPVHVETAPGAAIWIDDQFVGSAPLGATEVPIGTHEVVARHPDLGERRQSVDVKFGETTELTLDFNDGPQAADDLSQD